MICPGQSWEGANHPWKPEQVGAFVFYNAPHKASLYTGRATGPSRLPSEQTLVFWNPAGKWAPESLCLGPQIVLACG